MKKSRLLVGLFLMLVFILIASFLWFRYFLDLGSDGTLINGSNTINGLKIEDENKVYETFKEGVSNGDDVVAYRFKIVCSNQSNKYSIKIVEVSPNKVHDGCSDATLLKREELNYSLKLNGELIQEGRLDTLLDDTLDTRSINIDTTNNYELKIWINEEAKDFNGKHYHYKVELKEAK